MYESIEFANGIYVYRTILVFVVLLRGKSTFPNLGCVPCSFYKLIEDMNNFKYFRFIRSKFLLTTVDNSNSLMSYYKTPPSVTAAKTTTSTSTTRLERRTAAPLPSGGGAQQHTQSLYRRLEHDTQPDRRKCIGANNTRKQANEFELFKWPVANFF